MGDQVHIENDLSNLSVAVRIRPLNAGERGKGSTQIAYKVDDQMVVLMDPGDRWDEFLRNKRVREKKFLFDSALGPSATQEEVYQKTTKSLIDSVMNGFNATAFAYGATGAGKTYTMLGTDENPGIMARALDELFRRMDSNEHTFSVRMSYLEIYNEMIRDLLHPSSGILDLREDSRGTILVAGLSETQARSSREVLQLLMQGNRRRTQEPTAANKTSSRSHAVLQVTVTQQSRLRAVKDKIRVGKLFLIDLAGSERASRTKNRGKRMKEGAHINRSLLALGNVINTLTEKGSKYVNYRDSKLTRILKDSLGGNSKTVMIAHISPAAVHFEETRNTLIYADRAKNITTKLMANTQEVTHHVTQYQTIIAELRKEISRLKSKIDSHHHTARSPSPAKNHTRSESASSYDERDNLGARLDTVLTGYDMPYKQKSEASFATTIREINEDHREEFNKLKAELVTTFQEQMKMRHRLMELNDQGYETAVLLSSKSTVLKAWEDKQKDSGEESGKEPESIRKLVEDVERLEKKLDSVFQKKSEMEWDLAVSHKKQERLEGKLPDVATNLEQRELLAVLSKLHEAEVEKTALQSDALILNRRIERQETSLKKVKSYHAVCDDLIDAQNTVIKGTNNSTPEKISTLNASHKALRNQANYYMLPLDKKAADMTDRSWNRIIMERERAKSEGQQLSKTLNHTDLQKMKTEMELANRGQKKPEYGKENSTTTTVKLPPIKPVEVKYSSKSKDDSTVKYDFDRKNRELSLEHIRSKAQARRDSSATWSNDIDGQGTPESRPRSRSRSAEQVDPRHSSRKLSRRNSDNDLTGNRKAKQSTRTRNPPNRRVRSPTRPHLPVIVHR